MTDQPELLRVADDGATPNTPCLPALLYRAAVPPGDPAAAEAAFARHGWPPAWRNGIFSYLHYHPDAHEALAIARGSVRVQLGGDQGRVVDLAAGDVVVLPAGTGHRNRGGSADLLVIGAYPAGQSPTECRGRPEEHTRAVAAIALVPEPPRVPVNGEAWPR